MTSQNAQQATQEVALSNPAEPVRFDPDDLRSIASFDDAARLVMDQMGGTIVDAATEIGDGFTMVDDKSDLVNTPMILVSWNFAAGDFGAEYVIVRAVTDRNEKVIFVDGGTGICDQLRSYTQRTDRNGGMLVQRGLRKSEYDNEYGHGTTFYLNV